MVNNSCLFCGGFLPFERWKYCSKKCTDRMRYQKNKDKYLANARKWDKENPEKRKEINARGCKKFFKTEKGKAAARRSYLNNKQKNVSRGNAYIYREKILKKKGGFCTECGSKEDLEIHHLDYTWDKAGSNKNNLNLNIDKVAIFCRKCHRKEHKKTKHLYR